LTTPHVVRCIVDAKDLVIIDSVVVRAEHGFGATRGVRGTGCPGPGPVCQAHTRAKTVHTVAVRGVDGCEAHMAMTMVRRRGFRDLSHADDENGDCNRRHNHKPRPRP
jgi:hypothetical protein